MSVLGRGWNLGERWIAQFGTQRLVSIGVAPARLVGHGRIKAWQLHSNGCNISPSPANSAYDNRYIKAAGQYSVQWTYLYVEAAAWKFAWSRRGPCMNGEVADRSHSSQGVSGTLHKYRRDETVFPG